MHYTFTLRVPTFHEFVSIIRFISGILFPAAMFYSMFQHYVLPMYGISEIQQVSSHLEQTNIKLEKTDIKVDEIKDFTIKSHNYMISRTAKKPFDLWDIIQYIPIFVPVIKIVKEDPILYGSIGAFVIVSYAAYSYFTTKKVINQETIVKEDKTPEKVINKETIVNQNKISENTKNDSDIVGTSSHNDLEIEKDDFLQLLDNLNFFYFF